MKIRPDGRQVWWCWAMNDPMFLDDLHCPYCGADASHAENFQARHTFIMSITKKMAIDIEDVISE